MRKSDAVQPTAQSLMANFAPEALFKGDKQVVNRVKRSFLNKLPKSLNIFNVMAMPLLIFGFGMGSAFFRAHRTKWRLKNAVNLMLQGFKRGQNL